MQQLMDTTHSLQLLPIVNSPTMTKIPLCLSLLLMAQASMAFVSCSSSSALLMPTAYHANAGWASSCIDLSPQPIPFSECERPRILLPSPRRSRKCHRFMTGLFRLRASSIDRESDVSAPPTTGLKALASQIEKNNSSRGMAGRSQETSKPSSRPRYQLGVGKNLPVVVSTAASDNTSNNSTAVEQKEDDIITAAMNWNVPEPATRKQ